MTTWALLTVALVAGGVLLGAAVGRRTARPTTNDALTPDSQPTSNAAAIPNRADAKTPIVAQDPGDREMLAGALDRYPVGVVIADSSGHITFRNHAARSYDGTHVAALLDAAIERRLETALRIGSDDEADGADERGELVEFYGPPRQVMSVITEPLTGGAAVAFVNDVTESDRLDRVRTDFVANVSHELKTPIGALTLLAEALADETDEAVRERLIARMEVEAERAGKTIEHLVELSEIESTPAQTLSVVGVRDLIDASIDRVLELARYRSVTIESVLDSATGARQIRGQRIQLESALGNLVENAVAYSPPTSTITVRADVQSSSVSDDADLVEIAVIDSGVGIPQGQQDRIFERFYRVDRARSRETGGTGLGLSIVKRAAIAHGGSVAVTSVEGEGSTFVLRLPLAVDDGPTDGDGPNDDEGRRP